MNSTVGRAGCWAGRKSPLLSHAEQKYSIKTEDQHCVCCPGQSSVRPWKGRNCEQVYSEMQLALGGSISAPSLWTGGSSSQGPGHGLHSGWGLDGLRRESEQRWACLRRPRPQRTRLRAHMLVSCPEGASQLLGLLAVCLTWWYWEQNPSYPATGSFPGKGSGGHWFTGHCKWGNGRQICLPFRGGKLVWFLWLQTPWLVTTIIATI